jgi:hypothetical protein
MGARRLTLEEREDLRAQMLQQKDQYELKRCGGYERIFPVQEKQLQSDPKFKKLQD